MPDNDDELLDGCSAKISPLPDHEAELFALFAEAIGPDGSVDEPAVAALEAEWAKVLG